MSVIVRRAGRRDLKKIQPLWQALRELEMKLDERMKIVKDAADLAREHHEVVLADPRTALFVAEEKEIVLAYLHAQIESNDPTRLPERYGVILDLIVQDSRRREGIGTRLLECTREWFESQGIDELRVRTLARDNVAHDFLKQNELSPRFVMSS